MDADVRGNVLCVEDNRDECDLVIEILGDYEVTCVSTIAEACRLLNNTKYALIMIDEHLPDGSGLGLCGQIALRNAKTLILMVTGDGYMTNSDAVRSGAKALLTKSKVNYVEEIRLFAGHYADRASA